MKRTLTVLYFMASALILVMFSMQGFSFLDIGMYMSGYEHFNDEPYVNYFLGQWLLSFQLTGRVIRLLGIDSYWGLRMLRVALVVVMQVIIYLSLRRWFPRRFILLGLLLMTLAQQESYYEIYYNDYSMFLLVVAICLYFHGLTSERRWFVSVALAGVVSGVAVFFRAVNLSFILLPFYASLLCVLLSIGHNWWKQILWFFGGWACGVALALCWIHVSGMDGVLALTIRDLAGISTDGNDPHRLSAVMVWWFEMVQGYCLFTAIPILLGLAVNAVQRRCKRVGTSALVWMAFAVLMIVNLYYWQHVAYITVGLCVLGVMALFFLHEQSSPRGLFLLLSMFLPVVLIIGSNGGPKFNGQYLAWLPLPMALYFIWNFFKVLPAPWRSGYKQSACVGLVALFMGLLLIAAKREMSEDGPRTVCRYTIDSPIAYHIYTTAGNADMYNWIMPKVERYLNYDDYLYCNFSIPMVSVLGCRPYAVYSTVFSTTEMSRRYIDEAYRHTHKLPKLLLNTASMTESDRELVNIFGTYASYKEVWSSWGYSLIVPDYK